MKKEKEKIIVRVREKRRTKGKERKESVSLSESTTADFFGNHSIMFLFCSFFESRFIELRIQSAMTQLVSDREEFAW